MNKVTIRLSNTRSYSKLEQAVNRINETLYSDEMFKDDRIELKPVLGEDKEIIHYEITAEPLNLFQVGLRYGNFEENEYLQPYLMEFYKSIVSSNKSK
jgi:hypothetical protein